jgi:type IV pilus biogenesis protein CpaD/CtpE
MDCMKWWAIGVVVLAVGGCAAGPDEREFGLSVRAMIAAQTYDPERPVAVAPLDGASAEQSLRTYREPPANRPTLDIQMAK